MVLPKLTALGQAEPRPLAYSGLRAQSKGLPCIHIGLQVRILRAAGPRAAAGRLRATVGGGAVHCGRPPRLLPRRLPRCCWPDMTVWEKA